MSQIKSAFAGVFAWLQRCWRDDGSTALLGFFIAMAMVFALGLRR